MRYLVVKCRENREECEGFVFIQITNKALIKALPSIEIETTRAFKVNPLDFLENPSKSILLF